MHQSEDCQLYHLVDNEVECAWFPQHHPRLGQHPLRVFGRAVRFGAGLVARLPVARPFVGLRVRGVPRALEGVEEGGKLFQAALIQALVFTTRVQGPSQLVACFLLGEKVALHTGLREAWLLLDVRVALHTGLRDAWLLLDGGVAFQTGLREAWLLWGTRGALLDA
jgi:hypothetical protein